MWTTTTDPMTTAEAELRESGDQLLPKFDANGLITAMVVNATDNSPLMLAHMNAEALEATLKTGEAHFYSRSRQEIWHKGGTSGNVLNVTEIRIDCDQDAVWVAVTVQGHGAACHTGRKSCFYRRVVSKDGNAVLEQTGDAPLFDPETVYPK